MQNRYVADIGDFGKYHLLKSLCIGDKEKSNLSLGVVWYLVPDEGHNEDGKHTGYLERTKSNMDRFREGDPILYDTLRKILKDGKRDVSLIREKRVLPGNTVFYETVLSFESMPNSSPAARLNRIDHRNKWVIGALSATAGCDLIFVDPDNGLEVSSVKKHQKTGPKYTYFEELVPYVERGQSLVIYHHLCRNGSAEVQVNDRLKQIKDKLGVNNSYALLYRRGTLRAFFIVPSLKHVDLLKNRGVCLTETVPWNEHFSVIT